MNTSTSALDRFVEQRRSTTADLVPVHQWINFDGGNDSPLVTVLVPVMNVEDYLPECLESIAQQSLTNFEAICINDGSTDSSLSILEEFAARDVRFKVIDKENAGYGHAMNIGMDQAQGEFIAIVESDDKIAPTMLEDLYQIGIENDLDVVKADFYRFTTEPSATRLFYHSIAPVDDLYYQVVNAEDSEHLFRFTNTWCGIYRRSFLEEFGISHQESPGASYQDNGFWFQTTVAARRMMYIPKPYYWNRRDNPNSSVFNNRKVYAGNSEYAFVEKFFERLPELGQRFSGYLVKKKLDTYYYNFIRVDPELKWEYLSTCSQELAKDFAAGHVDKELFSPRDFRKLTAMVTDPEDFYSKNKSRSLKGFTGAADPDAVSLALITDNSYALPAAAAIQSMVENKHKDTNYHISIVGVKLDDDHVRRLTKFSKKDVTIEILQLSETAMHGINDAVELTDFGVPPTALVKFLLPQVLHNLDKTLYIDDDVIVKKDLKSLFATDLSHYSVGVVPDVPQVFYSTQSFGAEYGRDYFNSGVLLMNLERMRENDDTSTLLETKRTLKSRLQDQDVFNSVYANDKLVLPIKFNTLLVNLHRSEGRYQLETINKRFGTRYKNLEDIRRDSTITHFCSPDKPWKFYDVPLADDWLHYHAAGPYGDQLVVRAPLSQKKDFKPANGFYRLADADSDATHVAVSVRSNDLMRIGSIGHNLVSQSDSSSPVHLHVFHQGCSDEELETAANGISNRLNLNFWDIEKLVKRDRQYVKHPLPETYYKLVIPEVLSHLKRVLIIDGASVTGELADLLNGTEEDGIFISPTADDSLRYFDAAAILLNPQRFNQEGVKQRFFKHLLHTTPSKRSPAASIRHALRVLEPSHLYSHALSVDVKNMALLKADIARNIRKAPASPKEFAAKQAQAFDAGVQKVRASRSYRIGNALIRPAKSVVSMAQRISKHGKINER